MIGRLHHVIFDCPDPVALARFWSAVLGLPVTYEAEDFAVVSASGASSGLAFQRAPDHVPPRWPDPAHPQQAHLDVMVDDVPAGAAAAQAIGARRLADGEGGWVVLADPAGHPFCLVPRPSWAPPVSP